LRAVTSSDVAPKEAALQLGCCLNALRVGVQIDNRKHGVNQSPKAFPVRAREVYATDSTATSSVRSGRQWSGKQV